jgi:RNA polymerase sigma-70 factor (ECF subfamily)
MAREGKAKDPGSTTEGPGSPAETDVRPGTGVTTSGVRSVAGGGAAQGGTATAKLMSIYDELADKLRGHMLRHGVWPSNLEDAMQELMLSLLRYASPDDLPKNPSAYVFKAARTTAIRVVEEQHRHPLAGESDDDEGEIAAPSSRQGLFQKTVQAQRMRRLQEGLEQLSATDRAVIQMAHFEHMTQEEIAAELGISVEAVEKRYERALPKLKKLVRGEEGAA